MGINLPGLGLIQSFVKDPVERLSGIGMAAGLMEDMTKSHKKKKKSAGGGPPETDPHSDPMSDVTSSVLPKLET